jgi:DhnA family fructose-bisphosphate aldolase class Ia
MQSCDKALRKDAMHLSHQRTSASQMQKQDAVQSGACAISSHIYKKSQGDKGMYRPIYLPSLHQVRNHEEKGVRRRNML